MADDDQKTLTAEAEVEESEKSTDTKIENKKSDVPGASNDSADEGNDDSNEVEDAEELSQDEGEDSTPTKKENKSGYLLRQLSTGNPNMQALKTHLQTFVDAAEDTSEQKERQRDINDYVRDAATAQDNIIRDNEQVAKEIPMFDPNNKGQFNEVLYRRAYGQFARDMAIEDQNGAKDANGNPIIVGTRMRLIDFMREKAEDYALGSTSVASQGKQPKSANKADKSKTAKAKMDAAADTPGGASNSGAKGKDDEDPFLKGFDNPYAGTHAGGSKRPTNEHTWSEK